MSTAGYILCICSIAWPVLASLWEVLDDPAPATYHSLFFKVVEEVQMLGKAGLAAVILAFGATSALPALALIQLVGAGVIWLWVILDNPVDIEFRSKFYPMLALLTGIAVIWSSIVVL